MLMCRLVTELELDVLLTLVCSVRPVRMENSIYVTKVCSHNIYKSLQIIDFARDDFYL